MKIRQILSIGCFLWILATLRLAAQQPEIQPLPIDPKVKYGQLSNGLTYYIRHNAQPKDRADFFISQNVGSILEDGEPTRTSPFPRTYGVRWNQELPRTWHG